MDSQKSGRDKGKGPGRDSPGDEKTLKAWHEFAEKSDINVTLAQIAYELWVDKQFDHDQPNWNVLSLEEQARWPMAYSQPGCEQQPPSSFYLTSMITIPWRYSGNGHRASTGSFSRGCYRPNHRKDERVMVSFFKR